MPRFIRTVLCALTLAMSTAQADDADDRAEVLRMEARLRASIPGNLKVLAAEFGSGVRLQLRGAEAPQQASIQSGSAWVELKPSSYAGNQCPDAGIPIGRFSLDAGIRAFFKARAIAEQMGANAVAPEAIAFAHEAPACTPGWRITLHRDTHYRYLRFDSDGALVELTENAGGKLRKVEGATLRVMEERAGSAVPSLRAEAEPLPAEAEIVAPEGDEFLIATVDGKAYVCASADIHLVYDYYSLDLRCEGDSTRDTLVLMVPAVQPGTSDHRVVTGEPSPSLWMRQGLVDLESDSRLPDTRVRIDALEDRLVEGRFEGTVSNASGKRVRIANGRFRLLPGDGFSVSPP